MQASRRTALIRLTLCGVLFGCGGTVAQAQNGTLQLPPHRPVEAPPTPPRAAPLVPVQQVGPRNKPPVVAPHGVAHGHKPPVVAPHGVAHGHKPPVVAPHGVAHGHKPPVVAPRGVAHGHKPPARPAAHPPAGAKPAAKLPAAPVVAPVPVPAAKPPAAPAPDKGTTTGLPLPRFAALRADEVNLRAGPGTRYPIEWVYKRRDLPVEIEREFEVWRLVRDSDGIRGWVHEATLIGRRSFEVVHSDATLRAAPRETAAPVAILKPGVIGRIRSCAAGSDWCRVQAGAYGGFLPRSAFWGTLPDEVIGR